MQIRPTNTKIPDEYIDATTIDPVPMKKEELNKVMKEQGKSKGPFSLDKLKS